MKPKELYAKCGNVCSRCPSFKTNLKTTQDRLHCSAGWEKYLGFRLKPDSLVVCDGCQFQDDEKPSRYINCKTRKCAVYNGVLTCAHCSSYPCEDLPAESVSRESSEKRIGGEMSDEDYARFVEPYEGRKFLDQIRSSLTSGEIAEMKKVSLKPQMANFPEGLSLSDRELKSYKNLYSILSSVGTADGISYARKEVLKKKRRYLLKLLWAFGSSGELKDGKCLVIDAQTYIAQKTHSSLSVLNSLCAALKEYGLYCEHVPLQEQGWQTPTGALRPKGWQLKMTCDSRHGGLSALKVLKTYVNKLIEEYGDKAYRYFSRADMMFLERK
ncbi:DUF3795 domain-containing protein [candidate division WOR-3 bacterium]|uniref:DUF3795 domain-containing protein n=1 Tax=candidate division WOR-3 bacterium TaxID=2052148 RepID=A0A9D5K9V3_UNCW3|nr:DUF3795 domain-containing protein [candidate division WOR-3 bacterium]MBD3363936.1 DUF3795 domain-containing protein [candidate division WOR-3 bacterium]